MSNVRHFQRTLYLKSKQEKDARFHSLYDKLYRADVLQEAWHQVKANRGAPGIDGERIDEIVAQGREQEMIDRLGSALRGHSYGFSPVRGVEIPKPKGGTRTLGIATVEDRVVQTAMKIVLEPIVLRGASQRSGAELVPPRHTLAVVAQSSASHPAPSLASQTPAAFQGVGHALHSFDAHPPTLSRAAPARHDPREEPSALTALAGICGGGGQQWPFLLRLKLVSTRTALAAPGPVPLPFPDFTATTRSSDSPCSVGRRSGSPRKRPTTVPTLVLSRPRVRVLTRGASEIGHRFSVSPESPVERQGPPRLLGHPLRACPGRITPRRGIVALAQ